MLERQLRKITSRKLDPYTYKRKMYYGFKGRVRTTRAGFIFLTHIFEKTKTQGEKNSKLEVKTQQIGVLQSTSSKYFKV